VYLGLGFGDPPENIQGAAFRPITDPRFFNQAPDIPPGPVSPLLMTVVVVMTGMIAAVILMVMPGMVMPGMIVMMVISGMIVMVMMGAVPGLLRFFIPGLVILLSLQNNHRPGSGDAAAFLPAKIQFPARKLQFFQFPPQFFRIKAQIHQGTQSHIPGDSGKTVKM
jgi:hypothetical protein